MHPKNKYIIPMTLNISQSLSDQMNLPKIHIFGGAALDMRNHSPENLFVLMFCVTRCKPKSLRCN